MLPRRKSKIPFTAFAENQVKIRHVSVERALVNEHFWVYLQLETIGIH